MKTKKKKIKEEYPLELIRHYIGQTASMARIWQSAEVPNCLADTSYNLPIANVSPKGASTFTLSEPVLFPAILVPGNGSWGCQVLGEGKFFPNSGLA